MFLKRNLRSIAVEDLINSKYSKDLSYVNVVIPFLLFLKLVC